jgi:FLYWCH zinc finger domain
MATTTKAVRIPSVKYNQTVLFHDGYTYHYNQRSDKAKTTYYRCKFKKDCTGTGKIVDGSEFVPMRKHSNHHVTPRTKKKEKARVVIPRDSDSDSLSD